MTSNGPESPASASDETNCREPCEPWAKRSAGWTPKMDTDSPVERVTATAQQRMTGR